MIVHPILLQCQSDGFVPTYEVFVEKVVADDIEYHVGDIATFEIKAWHTYDSARTIFLAEIENVVLAQTQFDDVPPNQVVATTATYRVTEADALQGGFTNTITASVDGNSETADCTLSVESPDGHLTVEANWDLSDYPSDEVPLGGYVPLSLSVTNDGNLTITDITLVCELTGDRYPISSLAPGESEEFETSYTPTEADILVGEVTAVATASGDSPDPDNPDVPVYPGEDVFTTVSRNGHLTITARNTTHSSGPYALDDIIDVAFIVFNDGNLTLTNIRIESERTEGWWTIAELKPGDSESFADSTRVYEPDLVEGEIVIDYYVARNSSPDPDVPEALSTPDTVVVSTEAAAPHIVIGLSSISAGPYAPGDTVSVTVTVTNDGNLTSSATAVSSTALGNYTIGYLYPTGVGSTHTYTVPYTFTMADATRGYVDFAATVSGTTIDPNNPTVSATSTTQRITCQYVFSYKVNTAATTSGAKDAAIPFNLSNIPAANTMTVDWGDGTTSALKASDYGSNYSDGTASIHTYDTAGEYTIRITYDGDWSSTSLGWFATSASNLTPSNSNARTKFIGVFNSTITQVLTPLPPVRIIRYYSSATATNIPNTASNSVSHMFRFCTKLVSVPETLFANLGSATTSTYTFYSCSSLTSIPAKLLEPLTDTTTMQSLFHGCSSVAFIPAGLFDNNTKVTNLTNLFYNCNNSGLTTLPSGLFDKLTLVTNIQQIFYGMTHLEAVPATIFKNMTRITNASYVFYNCSGLLSVDGDIFRYNTAITNFQYCFRSCTSLTTLPADLFKYNTAVTNMKNVFASASNLGNFDIHIGSANVSSGNAASFVTKKTGATRTVRVPSGSTTQTTFNSVASSLGLTVVGE